MPNAVPVLKQLRYKAESTWGTAPGATLAQSLRRVSSTLALVKDTYKSAEVREDLHIADFRHGMRKVAGSISGELSPKTYADFFAAALRRDFAAVTALTALSITVSGTGPSYTITRAAGDFLAGGIKIGDVVRLTAGSFNALNLNKNLLVTAVTATTLGVITLNGSALFAEGPIASATVSVPGKKTFAPTSGHTDKSFAFEHWYSDIAQSELFLGCKPTSISLKLPPTGISTFEMQVVGKDIQTATAAYYTTPAALTATGLTAAVNGALMVGGVQIATVTGLDFNINPNNKEGKPVVGSNSLPLIAPGVNDVSGQFTAYFDGATLRDYFINETAISLVCALTTNNTAAADFVSFVFPNIKLGGAGKDDADDGIIQTLPFQGILNTAGGAGVSSEATNLSIQDSQA